MFPVMRSFSAPESGLSETRRSWFLNCYVALGVATGSVEHLLDAVLLMLSRHLAVKGSAEDALRAERDEIESKALSPMGAMDSQAVEERNAWDYSTSLTALADFTPSGEYSRFATAAAEDFKTWQAAVQAKHPASDRWAPETAADVLRVYGLTHPLFKSDNSALLTTLCGAFCLHRCQLSQERSSSARQRIDYHVSVGATLESFALCFEGPKGTSDWLCCSFSERVWAILMLVRLCLCFALQFKLVQPEPLMCDLSAATFSTLFQLLQLALKQSRAAASSGYSGQFYGSLLLCTLQVLQVQLACLQRVAAAAPAVPSPAPAAAEEKKTDSKQQPSESAAPAAVPASKSARLPDAERLWALLFDEVSRSAANPSPVTDTAIRMRVAAIFECSFDVFFPSAVAKVLIDAWFKCWTVSSLLFLFCALSCSLLF
jgi:hypothetical protein